MTESSLLFQICEGGGPIQVHLDIKIGKYKHTQLMVFGIFYMSSLQELHYLPKLRLKLEIIGKIYLSIYDSIKPLEL